MYQDVTKQAAQAMEELLAAAKLERGDLLVIGCSSSEMVGLKIGKGSSLEAARAAFDGIYPVVQEAGVALAVQCCEHLNRALIVERETAERYGYEVVNVRPQPKAGGSFATTAWERFAHPVAVEHIRARRGWTSAVPSLGCTWGRWRYRYGCPSPRLVRLPSCVPEPAPNSSAVSGRNIVMK